jgi:hypothetical protein
LAGGNLKCFLGFFALAVFTVVTTTGVFSAAYYAQADCMEPELQ